MPGNSSTNKKVLAATKENSLIQNNENESTASTLNTDLMPPVSNTAFPITVSISNDTAAIPRVTSFARTLPLCARCNRLIVENESHLFIQNKIVHTKCMRCSMCNSDFNDPIESQTCASCISAVPTVDNHPDPHQICTYRIVPPILISTPTKPQTVELVESGTRTVIDNGLSGVLEPEALGEDKYLYSGIKLTNKQPINDQVKRVVASKSSAEYRLKFSNLQGRSAYTAPFKIYSNLSLMDKQDRATYRKRKT